METDTQNQYIDVHISEKEDDQPAPTEKAAAAVISPIQLTPPPLKKTNQSSQTTTLALPMKRRRWLCFVRKNNTIDELITVISSLEQLDVIEKFLIRTRYIELLISMKRRALYYSILFRTLRLIVTIGSLLVPALLSVQYDTHTKDQMYWATWIISLAVTTSNGIFTLLKVDKKYYFIHTIMELLISEGWQYFALTGRYGESGNLLPAGAVHTHHNMFQFFCHYVEKIKMKQVEEEYYKGIESNQTQGQLVLAATNRTALEGRPNKLYPLTPAKNLVQTAKNLEKSTQEQIDTFLNNMASGSIVEGNEDMQEKNQSNK
jgi:hypothetical protein